MVDHDSQMWEPLGEYRDVVEVPGKDDRYLEDQVALLEHRDTLEDGRPNEPVVGFVVGQVSDAAKLGTRLQQVKPLGGARGLIEAHPRRDRADPVAALRLGEQVIAV